MSAGRLLGTHRPYDLRHSDVDVVRPKTVEAPDMKSAARLIIEQFGGSDAPHLIEMLGLDR